MQETPKSPKQHYRKYKLAVDDAEMERRIIDSSLDKIAEHNRDFHRRSGKESIDALRRASIVGENLRETGFKRRDEADRRVEEGLEEAAKGYAADPELYHKEALDDAAEADVDVQFDGDVASNVRPEK